ncbi:glycosyltransferase [Xenorhabdus bovienii]|uniref:Glycosyltransferase n=1 Tax=Xenorhabdus bovienii TaxID=40576 RepID=A0AAJ1N3N1_XENBV|nr:glycosyltransferase [Xenorhabdus bovienii]MDE1474603.1 glycosyltransferase [Xenorhabdus bovienii]MDE1478541.1 glycosyltransferase [Xenorhabdus bovienii]MDE9510259.1 glycosyltransferase [Xenorhabdus bovienii]MDE9521900.1 glycosyltransferase [Xenorhabdus bovienii]
MKKILIVTDISLSDSYNAGNKNGLLSLCAFLNNTGNCIVDILNFHHSKPSARLRLEYNIFHYPDFYNLLYRKFIEKLGTKSKLINYKNSYFRKLILKKLLKWNYDIVIIEYLENHHLVNICRKYSKRVICDLHDVMYLRRESFISNGVLPSHENLNITLDEEANAISKFDAVIAVENSEKNFIEKLGLNTRVILCKRIPTKIIEHQTLTPDISESIIGFIGSAAEFNYSTILDFIENVWNNGLFREDYKLIIAGAVCERLEKNNTKIQGKYQILGKIPDVSNFYSLIHASINPVWSGSGFKTKNAESLSYGVPVITSNNGIKGLEDISGQYCKIIEKNDISEWKNNLLDIFNEYKNKRNLKELCANHFKEILSEENCFNELREYLK